MIVLEAIVAEESRAYAMAEDEHNLAKVVAKQAARAAAAKQKSKAAAAAKGVKVGKPDMKNSKSFKRKAVDVLDPEAPAADADTFLDSCDHLLQYLKKIDPGLSKEKLAEFRPAATSQLVTISNRFLQTLSFGHSLWLLAGQPAC